MHFRFLQISSSHFERYSRRLLATASDTHICLYDPRQMGTSLYSVPFIHAADAVSVSWNADNCWIAVNCGQHGVLQADLSRSMSCFEMIPLSKSIFRACITCRNEKYPRQNSFVNDLLVVGDDAGVLHYVDKDNSVIQSLSIGDSPIISTVPLSDSELLVTTDTESRLLQFVKSIITPRELILQGDEEKADVVTMQEENEEEVETWMLQGRQSDYSRCSFDQFGSCRQQVFVCRTCRDQLDRYLASQHPGISQQQLQSFFTVGYLCEECAHFCHQNRGHDVVALGVKDHVMCDCGNKLFLQLDQLSPENTPFHQCLLFPDKPDFNTTNVYSHNCRERWCYCDDVERLPMVQCVKCCDWFHIDCAERVWSETHGGQKIDLNDDSIDFVCRQCEEKGVVPVPTPVVEEEEKREQVVEDVEDEQGLEELIRVRDLRRFNCRTRKQRMTGQEQ